MVYESRAIGKGDLVVAQSKSAATEKGKKAGRPPTLDQFGGPEHRQFPRAKMEVPFQIWIGEENSPRFSATLQSTNVSVSGAFLGTTFFLPIGSIVNTRFVLEGDDDAVEARAEIVREERPGGKNTNSGIGIRFIEFFKQTEVSLARLFLEEQLAVFVRKYLSSQRARSLDDETERIMDAVAAWELRKITSDEKDPWRTI
ncbi:MAG: PilZ domain-containing protein [Myxococcaceae bacterium]